MVREVDRIAEIPNMLRQGAPVSLGANLICGAMHLRGVVLVEGTSDRLAMETLARRRGHDLEAMGSSW